MRWFCGLLEWPGAQTCWHRFFVGVRNSAAERYFVYAVTAKHVIERIEAKSTDGFNYLRLNFRDSGAQWLRIDTDDWCFHPSNDAVDVAAVPFYGPWFEHQLDHRFYINESFATAAVIEQEAIGVGDEVLIVGLFGRHTGTNRNIPIVRVGNIATMSEEPLKTAAIPAL